MKRTKLNWKAVQKSRRKLLSKFSMIAATVAVYPISKMMGNTTFTRTSNQWEDDYGNLVTGKHFFLIKNKDDNGNIDDPWPCGINIAMSVEDNRYIFSKSSSLNATLVGGVVDYPEDGIGSNKKEQESSPSSYSYEQSFNRINTMKVGTYDTPNGRKVGINAEDAKANYPESTFPIKLDGAKQTAFNPENLFYEMLISIQTLSKKNAELELRLNQLELEKGIQHANESNSYIKILGNPVNSGSLEIEYFIEEGVKNASVSIVSMSGVKIQGFSLPKRRRDFKSFRLDLPNGLYLCVLLTDGTVINSQKFIVE